MIKVYKFGMFIVSVGFVFGLMTGCGGGGSDDAPESTDNITELSSINGYIVTDIIDMDLNDDGYQDLILFRTSENPFYSGLYIQALINNGDKTFLDASSTYFPKIGNNWKWIDKAYVVDLNRDGLLDIVGHVDGGISNLPPLIRKSTGEFEVTNNQTLVNNSGGMIPIDTDSDGDIDILVRTIQDFGHETDQVHQWVLLQNTTNIGGALDFQSLGIISNGAPMGWDYSAFVYAPVVVDINNDGYQDFVYGGPKWKNGFIDEVAPINVYINSTQNTFVYSSDQVFSGEVPSYTHVREMVSADLNNDGYKDILVANTGYDWAPYPGQRNAVLSNNGEGTFTEEIGDSTTHNYKGFTHSTDVGDIDADGDLDIVYTDILGDDVVEPDKIRILENDGTGSFSIKSIKSLSYYSWTSTKLADLDNDGYPDLILGAMDSTSVSVIMWNDGSGNF